MNWISDTERKEDYLRRTLGSSSVGSRRWQKTGRKENIGLLDENIGAFCDSTRDGIKGSALRAKEAGFINGAKKKKTKCLQVWQHGV